jgi:hypothetical protein
MAFPFFAIFFNFCKNDTNARLATRGISVMTSCCSIQGRKPSAAKCVFSFRHTYLIFNNFFLLTIQAILCQDTVIKYGSPGLFTRLSNKVGDFKKPLFQVLVIPRLLRFDYPER